VHAAEPGALDLGLAKCGSTWWRNASGWSSPITASGSTSLAGVEPG
jgi:hypothetical protein